MALLFDGVNDQVSHGNISVINGATNLTIMCWVQIVTLKIQGGFFQKGLTTGLTTWWFGSGTATASVMGTFFGAGANNWNGAAGTLETNNWNHFAMAYDGSGADNPTRFFVYKDGSDVTAAGTFAGTVPATWIDTTTEPVRSGVGGGNASDVFLNCRIAHGRIWTATLSATAILQEMNSFRPVTTAGLRLWVPYDDGVAAMDYSGSGNNGTVTEAVQSTAPPLGYGFPPVTVAA